LNCYTLDASLVITVILIFLMLFFLQNSRPGIVHTEKFWRENAKCLETDDFKLLKVLISLLRSDEEVRMVLLISF